MDERLPLSTLLSWAIADFTIEFDNEEHRLPHRTSRHGAKAAALHAPWLTSLVMWFDCMRFVDEKGIAVRELEQLARTKTNLNGMERWGYVRVEPDTNDSRAKPPGSAWLIRPKAGGRKAREVWEPLVAEIEGRWESRYGKAEIAGVRKALAAIVGALGFDLPAV